MTLEDIAAENKAVAFALIGSDNALARQVQQRLGEAGVLDPPVDGAFGPVSLWALVQFLRRTDQGGKTALDAGAARSLLSAEAVSVFPLNAPANLGGSLIGAMQNAGHWICRHPDCLNVIYVEGMDANGKPNANTPNEFNDVRIALRINRAGNPDIIEAWEGTTEPGRHYTLIEKLDPRGAARIAFGQYKAWSVGTHMAGRPSAHEALVQTAPLRVHRDLNADFRRTDDREFEGLFGVNQHWGFDLPKSDIGRASAGCLVGRTKTGHRAFMTLCKSDPRFLANNSYRFMSAVLPAATVTSVG
jgi:hypothetical protein